MVCVIVPGKKSKEMVKRKFVALKFFKFLCIDCVKMSFSAYFISDVKWIEVRI